MASEQRKRIWKISPGENARLWDEFIGKNCIAIGWSDVGNLKKYASDDVIREKFREVYPNRSPNQVLTFYRNIREGDIVIAMEGGQFLV